MAAYCLLLGSPTIGWYSGIVVLDVVRGKRVLDLLMLSIMHVRTFVEECNSYKKKQWRPPSKKKKRRKTCDTLGFRKKISLSFFNAPGIWEWQVSPYITVSVVFTMNHMYRNPQPVNIVDYIRRTT
jgi:hypothetical protein